MASIISRRLLNRNLSKFNKTSNGSSFYSMENAFLVKNHSHLKHYNTFLCANLCNIRINNKIHYYSTIPQKDDKPEEEKKLSLFQKFKKMYKEYWYVLVPVHLVTSAGWFGGFYYLAKSGVDIPALLQSMHVSESFIKHLRDSHMGYIAVSYALYKIATPLRYTVTLGGTTISINYLKKWGYIKPMPSKERMIKMYQERANNLMETVREKKEEIKEKTDTMVEKFKTLKDDSKDDLLKKQSEKIKHKNK